MDAVRCCRAQPILGRPRDFDGSISPHWENLLTHCGFYKCLMNMPLRPKILPPSSIFTRSKQRICFAGQRLQAPRKVMLPTRHALVELACKHGPQEEHTRCARVGSPNPEELLGKRRDRLPYTRDLSDSRQTTRKNKALGFKSG